METEKWNFPIIQDIRLYPPNEYTNNRMKNNHQELNGLHPILIASHKKSEISHFRRPLYYNAPITKPKKMIMVQS